jgi:hypothetical protein
MVPAKVGGWRVSVADLVKSEPGLSRNTVG